MIAYDDMIQTLDLAEDGHRGISHSTNERGNRVSSFHAGPASAIEDRYIFDFEICPLSDGWRQYDTTRDAPYFGVWVHLGKLAVVTYAEGDVSVVRCPDVPHLRAELESMASFYGDPPPAAIAIDADGTVTEYYDRRPDLDVATA